MWSINISSRRVYRLILTIFGVGAAGTALAATDAPGDIFARQFLAMQRE
jgi:hypothetical protein